MTRVLVAEDSPTARALLLALFASDPDFEVVGEAQDGVEAIELTKALRPDVVTMDVNMPRLDGLQATQRIMVEHPTPIIIVSASLENAAVAASLEAVRAGALMALAKPPGPGAQGFEQSRQRFLATVKALASVKVVGHRLRLRAVPVPRTPAVLTTARAKIGALAASTGGPGALKRVLDALPADFPVPLVIVQHLASGFLAGFVEWLGNDCRLHVKVAAAGDRVVPGVVYIASEDRHLEITSAGMIRASMEPPVDGFRPSASVLFQSVGDAYGDATVAAILTGMGRDGVAGLRRIRAVGGRIIAQDERTSAVFGMPAAAIEAGLADFVLPISSIASKLVELVSQECK